MTPHPHRKEGEPSLAALVEEAKRSLYAVTSEDKSHLRAINAAFVEGAIDRIASLAAPTAQPAASEQQGFSPAWNDAGEVADQTPRWQPPEAKPEPLAWHVEWVMPTDKADRARWVKLCVNEKDALDFKARYPELTITPLYAAPVPEAMEVGEDTKRLDFLQEWADNSIAQGFKGINYLFTNDTPIREQLDEAMLAASPPADGAGSGGEGRS